jgi:hypothetical protein
VTVPITATARGPDNAEVTRVVVIRIIPAMPQGYVVLAGAIAGLMPDRIGRCASCPLSASLI